MTGIALDGVTKTFDDGTVAVSGLDLDIADGEFMVLVGPSGCGKTTGLRMVAGLEGITSGIVRIGDEVVNDLPPKDRDVAMVFQNYALYPHMSVYENMAFALKLRKLSKAEIDKRVRDAARILGLTDYLGRKPKALSGGQRQRVAMGRAIVREPKAFLMDEPLSNLDAKLRVQMRAEISKLQGDLGVTTIYVTHDQTEAMTMGDRVAVMRSGHLQQVDVPQRLYDRPANMFVAGFIGSPAMNLVEAELARVNDHLEVSFGRHRLELPPSAPDDRPGRESFAGGGVIVGMRPENVGDAALETGSTAGRELEVDVTLLEALGSEVLAHFSMGVEGVRVEDADVAEPVDDDGSAILTREDAFVARLDPRTEIGGRGPARFAVDTGRLYFFDPASEDAIYD